MYYILDEQGKLISEIYDLSLTSASYTEVEPPERLPNHELYFINGSWIQKAVEQVITYRDMRKMSYPPVEEQIDMIWHAMDTGQLPKAEPFYSSILLIKESIPKPNSGTEVLQ